MHLLIFGAHEGPCKNNKMEMEVICGIGSLLGGAGQYLVVLGHYWVVLVSTWCYQVVEVDFS